MRPRVEWERLLRDPRSHLGALLALNLAWRILFFTPYVNIDLLDYLISARHLAEGTFPRENPFFAQNDHLVRYGVVLPLALLKPLFGLGLGIVFLFGAAVSTTLLIVLHRLAWRWFGGPAADFAGLLLVCLPFQEISLITGHAHLTGALLALSSAGLFARAIEDSACGPRRWLGAGLLLGLAQVTVPATFLFVPAGVAWCLWERVGWRRGMWWFALGVGIVIGADVVFSGAWFGNPLFRYAETQKTVAHWTPLGFSHVTLIQSFTEPFVPTTPMASCLGVVPWAGLAGMALWLARRSRMGRFIALLWIVPFVLLRLIPYRLSPLEFLAPVTPHWAILPVPFLILAAGAGLGGLWEFRKSPALAAGALAALVGVMESAAWSHDYGARAGIPSKRAYEWTRQGDDPLILDFVTRRHFFVFAGLDSDPRWLDVGEAQEGRGKGGRLVVIPTIWSDQGVQPPASLLETRAQWRLLAREEWPGRIRFRSLLKLTVERTPPIRLEIYRIPE